MWMLDSPPSPDLNPYDALQITPEELFCLEAEEHQLSDTSPPHHHQPTSSSSSNNNNNDKNVPLSIRTIINNKKNSTTITTAPLSPKIKAFLTTPTSKAKASSSSKHSAFFTATTTTTGSPSAKFSTGCIKDLIATAKLWAPHAATRGKLYKNSPLDVFYEALTAAKTNIASCNPDQLLELSFTLRPILCHALSNGYKRQQMEDIADNIMSISGSRLAKVAYLAALSLCGEGGGEVPSPPISLPSSSSNYNTANKQVFHTLLRASCRFATHVCLDNGIPIKHHFLRSLSFFLKQFIPDMSLKTIGEALSLFNALKWRPFEAEDIAMSVLQLLAKQQTNYKHGTANANGTKTPTCDATNDSSNRVNNFTRTPTRTPTPTLSVTFPPPLPPFSLSSSSSHWSTNSSNIREFVNIMEALVQLRCIEDAHIAGAFIDLVARNVLIMDDSDSDDDLEEKFAAMASFVLDEDDDDGTTTTTTTTTPLPPPPPVPNLLARLKNDVASYCSIIHSCALLTSQLNIPNNNINNSKMTGRHVGLYQSILEQFLDFASTIRYDHGTTTTTTTTTTISEISGGTGFMMYINDIPFSSSLSLAATIEKTIVVASFIHHNCVRTKPSSDLIAASRNLLGAQSSLSSNSYNNNNNNNNNSNGGGRSSSPSPPPPPTTNNSNSIQSPLMNMAKRKMHLLITDILPRHSLSSVTCEHGSSLKYINHKSKSTTTPLSSSLGREKLAVCIHGDEEYLLVDTIGLTRYGTTGTGTTGTGTGAGTKYSRISINTSISTSSSSTSTSTSSSSSSGGGGGNTVSRMRMLSGEALGREACLFAQGYYVLSIDLHSLTTLPLDVLRGEVKMMLQSGSTSAALSSWC